MISMPWCLLSPTVPAIQKTEARDFLEPKSLRSGYAMQQNSVSKVKILNLKVTNVFFRCSENTTVQ